MMSWSSLTCDLVIWGERAVELLLYYQVHVLCANCCLCLTLHKQLGENGTPKMIINRIKPLNTMAFSVTQFGSPILFS